MGTGRTPHPCGLSRYGDTWRAARIFKLDLLLLLSLLSCPPRAPAATSPPPARISEPLLSAAGGGRLKEHEHGHRRSFSSVIVRYSASNKTSPVPSPPLPSSPCSSSSSKTSATSSVRTSSESDDAGPALRRSSSASSEVENPIAYCKKSQQLASVRKNASDAGFRFLSSAASKIAAESEGLDELIKICRA